MEDHLPKMLPGTLGLAKCEQKYLGKDLAPSPTACVAVILQEKSLYIYVMMQCNYSKILLVTALSFPEAALREEAGGSWS